jgi:hypothetical protein
VIVLILVLVGGVVAALVSLYSAPALSPAEASATAEARKFATAEVSRRSTAVSIRRTATAAARSSGTAEAIARSTRLVQATATAEAVARSTSTADAVASAIAPGTQTAVAMTEAERRTQADLATSRLDAVATPVFGPASGTLDPHTDNTATCDESNLVLHNFIVSAHFYNPTSASQRPWEYGLTFSNEDEDTHYIYSARSTNQYALRLSGPSFYIESNNSTDLIDLSRSGDNTLKLYLEDDTAYLYINGLYADTIDLNNLAYGQSNSTLHSPMACSNLGDPANQEQSPALTRYDIFTVWSLP